MAITLGLPSSQSGGRVVYEGTFTHTAGAAPETFTLGSGQCVHVEVDSFDAGAKKEIVSAIQSGTTVTVYKLDAVTSGRIRATVLYGN